jgi:parvulin-like peptidyl-prolyl isomerase
LFRVRLLSLLLCLSLLCLPVVAAGCGGGGSGSASNGISDTAAVVVGGVTIPKSRIAQLMRQARINFENQGVPFPKAGSLGYRGLRGRAVAYLTVGALYEAKAAKEGVTASEAEVQAQLKRERKTYGKTRARQEKAMKEQGVTEAELKAQARLKVIERKVQERVYSKVKVTDADARRYYAENKERYTIPSNRVIRQILVGSNAEAIKLRDMARNGSDFGALAKKYSDDKVTARAGGKVTINKGQSQPQFDKVAFSIGVGEVSDPIKTQYGWQLLQPIGPVKAAVVTPYSTVARDLRRQLLETRQQHALSAWQLAARNEFCKGNQVKFSPGYRPFHDDDPCTATPSRPPASG